MKLTMSLNECVATMRESGIPCSPRLVGDAIEQGIYPFGRVKCAGKTGKRAFEIFTCDFERWLKSLQEGVSAHG